MDQPSEGDWRIRPVQVDDLRRSQMLAFWPPAALERIARASTLRWHEDGDVLARAWEPATAIWLVVKGCLELTRTSATGQRYLVDLMSAPQVAGLVPMIDGRETLFETRVRSRSRLICCPNAVVKAELVAEPSIGFGLMQMFCLRQRMEYDRAVMNAFDPVRVQVAKTIIFLARRPGLLVGGGEPLPMPVTYEDIADFLALSKSAVVKVVRDLIAAGAVKKQYRGVYIADSERLLAISQSVEALNDIARQYISETTRA